MAHLEDSTTEDARKTPSLAEDKRLDRLLDYTKFHIGIYLSIGGGLVVLLGSAKEISYIQNLIGCPIALLGGLICMGVAGLTGGIIASSCTKYRSFHELWDKDQGPYGSNWIKGHTWAAIEHTSFWLGLLLITFAVLSSKSVWTWVTNPSAS